MELIEGLIVITTIHLLAAASPGPDFVLVSQQTLTYGKKAGMLTSIGISLGLSIHILYSALGLAAIIANSTTLLWLIKLLGACYLFYLGYQGIKAKPVSVKAIEKQTLTNKNSAIKTIATGFLCNALNPKAPVYFVALFTLVLSPTMPLFHIMIYGLWMMAIQLIWFSSVSLLLSRPKINRQFQKLGHWLDRILGGAMILMGLKVLSSKIN